MAQKSIKIQINEPDFKVQPKTNALQTLADLDLDVLEKLANLSKNPKALEIFRNPPPLLKTFLGIK